LCAKTYPVRVVDGEVSVGIDCGESAEPGSDVSAAGHCGATAHEPGHLA
jgi:hypothetical protein